MAVGPIWLLDVSPSGRFVLGLDILPPRRFATKAIPTAFAIRHYMVCVSRWLTVSSALDGRRQPWARFLKTVLRLILI